MKQLWWVFSLASVLFAALNPYIHLTAVVFASLAAANALLAILGRRPIGGQATQGSRALYACLLAAEVFLVLFTSGLIGSFALSASPALAPFAASYAQNLFTLAPATALGAVALCLLSVGLFFAGPGKSWRRASAAPAPAVQLAAASKAARCWPVWLVLSLVSALPGRYTFVLGFANLFLLVLFAALLGFSKRGQQITQLAYTRQKPLVQQMSRWQHMLFWPMCFVLTGMVIYICVFSVLYYGNTEVAVSFLPQTGWGAVYGPIGLVLFIVFMLVGLASYLALLHHRWWRGGQAIHSQNGKVV